MSQGSQQVVSKLNELLTVNRLMEQHLAKGAKGGKNEEKGEGAKKSSTKKEDIDAMASLSTSMATLVTALKDSKKIDPKKGEALGEFVLNFTNKIKTVIKQLDKDKLKEFTNIIDVMQKGVAGFIFKMAAVAILTPVAMIGAAGFGVMVLILMNIFSKAAKVNKDTINGIASIVNMSKGMAILVLVLVSMALTAPLIAKGFLVFSLVVIGISGLLRIVDIIAAGGLNPISKGPLGSLMRLAKGMALFTLTLVGMALVAPVVAMGFLVFSLVILGIALVLRVVDFIAGGGFNPLSKGPLGSLAKLGFGLAAFALTLVLITFVKEQFIVGALMIMLAITAFGTVIWGLSKILNKGGIPSLSLKDKGPLPDLLKMTKALFIFALTAVAVGFFIDAFSKGALGLLFALGAFALVMIPYQNPRMRFAGKNLMSLSLGISVFAIAIGAFSWMAEKTNLTWNKLAMLGAAITGAALVGYVLGTANAAVATAIGSKNLLLISYAFGVFAGALGAYALMAEKANLTWGKLAMLGAAIGTAALVGTLLGIPAVAPWVAIGAPLLMTVGFAFAVFAGAMAVFALAAKDLSWKTLGMLSASIATVALVGTLLGTPWAAPFVFTGALALGALSVALLPFAHALNIFSKTKWTKKQSQSLSYAIESIAGAFAKLAKGGNWGYTMLGIFGMRDVGNTLISLAGGIQAMANMTFTEYEWDEATKKLQPKKKVKLTREDVKAAADNAAYTIGALTLPLATFGQMFSGLAIIGHNPYAKMGLTSNGIKQGISSLSSLGTGLSKLAGGVSDWASMSYWEYGLVYNPKTKMNELKPIKKSKITPGDISNATTNISNVLSAMMKPIAGLGALMTGGQAAGLLVGGITNLFSGGKNPVQDGIKSLSSIGTGIGKLASGVSDWAKMSYWEWGLVYNPKTKQNELKKIAQKKITPADIKTASENIELVLFAMMKPIAGLGALMTGGQAAGLLTGGILNFFSGGKNPVQDGINAIGTIGKGISNLATGIHGFAKMEIIEQIIQKDPKTGLNVLVPGKVTKLSKDMIDTAAENIAQILIAGVKGIAKFAYHIKLHGGEEQFNESIKTAGNLSNQMSNVYKKISEAFSDTGKIKKTTDNWSLFFEKIFKPFDADAIGRFTQFGKLFGNHIYKIAALTKKYYGMDFALKPQLLWKYKSFTETTERLAKITDPFTKFVKAFGDMANHMGVFSKNFKVMDPVAINAFRQWSDSMIQVSKIDITKSKGIIDFINGSVDSAFGAGKSPDVPADKKPQDYSESDKRSQVASTVKPTESAKKQTDKSEPREQIINIDSQAIANAITAALRNLTVNTITTKSIIENP